LGISRQGYYYKLKKIEKKLSETELIVKQVQDLRKTMPRIGGRKLYFMMRQFFKDNNIAIGRDKFFDILRENGLLVKQRKNYKRTTFSNHNLQKYKNLVKDLPETTEFSIWVCDITYLKTKKGFCYLSLITDARTKKIIGFNVSDDLRTESTIVALEMALKCGYDLTKVIHHSDRGSQYCAYDYVKILKSLGIQISMTESGDPRDNAIAERVNGILKTEFLCGSELKDKQDALKWAVLSIERYNNLRPHLSIGLQTPAEAEFSTGDVKKMWKTYYKNR